MTNREVENQNEVTAAIQAVKKMRKPFLDEICQDPGL